MAPDQYRCTCFIISSKMLRLLADETSDEHERCVLLDQAERTDPDLAGTLPKGARKHLSRELGWTPSHRARRCGSRRVDRDISLTTRARASVQ